MQALLDQIATDMAQATDRGQVATYIPELAKIDPNQFGIAVALPNGETFSAGDATTPFSIQSISKVFTLAIALGRLGDQIWARVGREPSGLAFNSILQLEQENGIPRNPFVNAGAIAVTDAILQGRQPREVLAELLRFIQAAAEDDSISINQAVAKSEQATAHRNIALAEFMAAMGNLRNPTALTIGRGTLRKMRQNLGWAVGYNVVALPIAAGVFAGVGLTLRPEIAALSMSGSSLIVAVNALLLKRLRLPDEHHRRPGTPAAQAASGS